MIWKGSGCVQILRYSSRSYLEGLKNTMITGKTEVYREEPVAVPFCSLQIPHVLVWDQAQTFVMRDRNSLPEPWRSPIDF